MLRALGATSLVAFGSLWVQIDGLVGSNGILPFRDHLDAVAASASGNPFWEEPTLFWWWPTDAALHVACGLGCLGSALLMTGLPLEGPVLLGLWALYLSLSQVGQIFLGYQWDTLLTETLFTAMLVARWHPWSSEEPARLGVWALRLLLFKLMLGSGLVKLTSGDGTWRDGTALAYHYWTQPIPNPLSWRFHHLPAWWHHVETWLTLIIEIPLPFAIFAGRMGRRVAFVGFTLVLAMLFATGNYGFFQLLSMVLVLSLLDDADWRGLTARLRMRTPPTLAWAWRWGYDRERAFAKEVLAGAVLTGLIAIGLPMQYGRTWSYRDLPPSTVEVLRTTSPFRTVNAYGLFASMTTTRPEVRIEGSLDGRVWKPYVFRYKPGPLDRAPPVVAPHMPRLDWQMWFAALRSCQRSTWVPKLMERLADNEPAVVALIAEDPFPDGGPRYIRAQRSLYTFTERGPEWWASSTVEEPYCRAIEVIR
ncbi:MAG: lipase maturation factor family protein [Alphaproteobacteria bacterium]|nr:lipase maturation factor family protein [Alphaproteobacteria bacterium]